MYDNTRLRREIGRFLRTLPDRNLTDRYVQSLRRTLLRFNDHCRERSVKTAGKVSREDILSFMDGYATSSMSSQRSAACAVRMFLSEFDNKAMRKLNLRYSGFARVSVDWLTPEETEKVLGTYMTPRQSVLISAGLLQGLRRIETIRITVRDAEDALRTGILRVRGKGHKERAVPLHDQFKEVLAAYVGQLEARDDRSTLLGVRRTRSEEDLEEFCVRFGKRFGFHTLRRSFGRNLWLLGARLETISELLGHSSTDMTRLYLGLNLTDMRSALSAYKIEVRGRTQ